MAAQAGLRHRGHCSVDEMGIWNPSSCFKRTKKKSCNQHDYQYAETIFEVLLKKKMNGEMVEVSSSGGSCDFAGGFEIPSPY